MRILAVDTSSERGSVCVSDGEEVLGEVRLASSVQHSERLFRSIELLLDYVPFSLADIDVFAAARGPGSFTGLRVGLAACEAFAAAYNRPGVGVSTLEALAWKSGITEDLVASVMDARRGEVYAGLYRKVGRDGSDELTEEMPPVVCPPDAWFARLPDTPISFIGDGARRYREFINRPLWYLSPSDLYLAATISQMAATRNSGPLKPLYVRKTDAEIAREGRHESLTGPNTKS